MAKQFVVWVNVIETHKIWFEADSLEEARTIVDKARDGDEAVDWIYEAHNGDYKIKGIDLEIDEPEEA